MPLLILLPGVAVVALGVLVVWHYLRHGSAEFPEEAQLAAARLVTTLPSQPTADERE